MFSLASETLFKPTGPDKAFSGHLISYVTVADARECLKLCLVTVNRKSFNFSEQKKKCGVAVPKLRSHALEIMRRISFLSNDVYLEGREIRVHLFQSVTVSRKAKCIHGIHRSKTPI